MMRRAAHYLPAALFPFVYWALSRWLGDPFDHLTSATKAATYQVFAGACAALLAFGLTAFSVLFAVSSRSRLATVLAYGARPLQYWLTGALIVLAIATFGFALLVPLDSTDASHAARFVAGGLVIASATAVGELIWLGNRFFRLLSIDALEAGAAGDAGDFDVVRPDPAKHAVPSGPLSGPVRLPKGRKRTVRR